ncbi:hypothetical protein MB84_31320 (plasmid) [Pandoraea oxalativorans]|uniref:Transposase TnpC homeodomain domain-containing protein n=1 Tax=Pandoraea oxalativorans TaxID=573737 RepID=A0A192B0Q1_9BURK|nr:hypothetical protein MB84_31320 [Pandoraea oxalativorans]
MEGEIGQLERKLEELPLDNGETPAPTTPASEARVNRARKPVPAHLPRDTIVHTPSANAGPDCRGPLKQIRSNVVEQLE